MKKNQTIFTFLVFISCLCAMNVCASTINVPSDYATIQAGIDAAENGDLVLVQPGTYVEYNLDYNCKQITVASLFHTTQDTSYISQTIIDGNHLGCIARFYLGEDTTSVLEGFTITNGYFNYGGGISCEWYSSPTLRNLIITGNEATLDGGGISCKNYADPIIEDVVVTNNFTSIGNGGGIALGHYCSPCMKNIVVTDNTSYLRGGGISLLLECLPTMEHILIAENYSMEGGGIAFIYSSNPTLDRVTIANNSSTKGGGVFCVHESFPVLINTIVWNNTPQQIYLDEIGHPDSITISYSDIQGGQNEIVVNSGTVYWNEGNMNSDPLFGDDFHLTWADFPTPNDTKSPCIDAGDPGSSLDPDGTTADMGAYFFNQDVAIDDPHDMQDCMLKNYPNPLGLNANTVSVSFSLKKNAAVCIQLFNTKGQLIETLMNEEKTFGDHTMACTLPDLTSGIYFTRLKIDGINKEITKLVVMK